MILPLALTNLPLTSHWSNADATWVTVETMKANLRNINKVSLCTSNMVDPYLKIQWILSYICMYYLNCFEQFENVAKIYRKAQGKKIRIWGSKCINKYFGLIYSVINYLPNCRWELCDITVSRAWDLRKPFLLTRMPMEEWFVLGVL